MRRMPTAAVCPTDRLSTHDGGPSQRVDQRGLARARGAEQAQCAPGGDELTQRVQPAAAHRTDREHRHAGRGPRHLFGDGGRLGPDQVDFGQDDQRLGAGLPSQSQQPLDPAEIEVGIERTRPRRPRPRSPRVPEPAPPRRTRRARSWSGVAAPPRWWRGRRARSAPPPSPPRTATEPDPGPRRRVGHRRWWHGGRRPGRATSRRRDLPGTPARVVDRTDRLGVSGPEAFVPTEGREIECHLFPCQRAMGPSCATATG